MMDRYDAWLESPYQDHYDDCEELEYRITERVEELQAGMKGKSAEDLCYYALENFCDSAVTLGRLLKAWQDHLDGKADNLANEFSKIIEDELTHVAEYELGVV